MKKSNERWTCYLKTDIGRQVLRFSLAFSAASLVAGIALLLQVPSSAAQRRPQPEILPSDKFDGDHFLTFNGKDDAMSACLYYKAIEAVDDCDTPRFNFTQWKMKNGLAVNPGFDDARTGEASALYFNAVDLALVRSMHGKTSVVNGDLTTAYYVCNYTPKTLDREGILDALEKARRDPRNSNAAACVAFDFSAKRPFTKFYVFNDKGILSPSANLDGHIGHPVKETGNKYVPGLCKTCHGADKVRTRDKFTVNDPPDGDIGAHFLPFDLDNFDYLDDSRVTRRAQEGKFKRLNDMIRAIEPTTSVIGELIDGWYKGGRIEQDSEFIPPEWMENEQLYRRVVKPSCRTCHVALTPNFATLEVFKVFAKSIHDHVCADAQVPFPRSMPNSKVTFDQFWLSRVQGTVLVRFLRDELEKPSMPSITCPPPPPP